MSAMGTPPDQFPEPLSFVARLRQSSFVRAVAGTAGTNVLATAAGSLGGLLLARGLGPSDRGVLALVVAWPTFVAVLVAAGLPQAITYFNARRPDQAPAAVATATAAVLVLSVILGVAGALCAPLITDRAEAITQLRLLFLLLPLYVTPVIWIASLQPKRIQLWNVARLVQPVSYFVFVLLLVATGRLNVVIAVSSLIVSLVLQAIVGAALSWTQVGPFVRPRRDMLWPLLGYGVRTVASGFPQIVNARLDQLILSLMVPAAALGNYAVAVSISLLATPIAYAFGYVAFPRIAAARERKEQQRLERVAILGSVGAAAVILAPLAILSPWLVPLLFGEGFEPAVVAVWILIPGTIALSSNQVAEDILRGRGQPLAPAIAETAGVVATLALLFVLVPRYGIRGAAATSTIAYVGVSLLLIWIRKRDSLRPFDSGGTPPEENELPMSADLDQTRQAPSL